MRRILFPLLVIGLAGGLFTLGSGAFFTDQATDTDNTIATGTVDINVSPTSATLTASNMAPGDTINGSIVVTNSGSLALRYALKSTTTENTLAAQLDMTVKTEGTGCNNFDGTTLYGPDDFGNTTGKAIFGDLSTHTGRTLAPSGSETLCFRVTLPTSTDNSFQGLTTTATLTFDAEQTANNP
jgi:spore coat-associated protein N